MTDTNLFAQAIEEILPDYLEYLQIKEICNRSSQDCLTKTSEFLNTFKTPYLRKRIKALRFKSLCDLYPKQEPLTELFKLASYSNSSTVFKCALKFKTIYPELSEKLFKLLFLRADREFIKIKNYYKPEHLKPEELRHVISNLLKIDYERPFNGLAEAEKLLLQLKKNGYQDKKILNQLLGRVYLRMKKYSTAAEAFIRAGEYYLAAIAFVRNNREDRLDNLILKLYRHKNPELYHLLLLKAEILRRKQQFIKAEKLLWRIYKYSSEFREEALWKLAWMSYLNRDIYSAIARLKRLQTRWQKDKYAYWLKKALQKTNGSFDANTTFIEGDTFYAIFDKIKNHIYRIKVSLTRQFKIHPVSHNRFLMRALALKIFSNDLSYINEVLWQYTLGNVSIYQACEFFIETETWKMMPWCETHLPEPQSYYYRYPFAYPEDIQKAFLQTGVEPLLILAIMKQESNFDPQAISRSGAIGLMQLMPFTARRFLKISSLHYREYFIVEKNILAAARYLRFLLNKFNNIPLAVAAYNAGEGNVSRWLSSNTYESVDEFIEDIPYEQTYIYTKKVLLNYYHYLQLYRVVSLEKGS